MRRGAVKLIGVSRKSVELCISPDAVNAGDPKPSSVGPVCEARELGEWLITNALPKDARASVTQSDANTITKDVGFFGMKIGLIGKTSLQYSNGFNGAKATSLSASHPFVLSLCFLALDSFF